MIKADRRRYLEALRKKYPEKFVGSAMRGAEGAPRGPSPFAGNRRVKSSSGSGVLGSPDQQDRQDRKRTDEMERRREERLNEEERRREYRRRSRMDPFGYPPTKPYGGRQSV